MHLTTRLLKGLSLSILLLTLFSCNSETEHTQTVKSELNSKENLPTIADAEAFIQQAEIRLTDLLINLETTQWVQSNFITQDTSTISARAIRDHTAGTVKLANQAKRFNHLELPAELARKMELLKLALTLPAPDDADKTAELANITAYLNGAYG